MVVGAFPMLGTNSHLHYHCLNLYPVLDSFCDEGEKVSDLPHGVIQIQNGQSFTPIEHDWKAYYYEAILAIAQSNEGKNPNYLAEQLAMHHHRMQLSFIITGNNEDMEHG